MVILRSLIYFLLQLVITPVFMLIGLLVVPLSPLQRYAYISKWAHIMLWLLRVVCGVRMEVRGRENIPAEPCLILCKHQSAWETMALQLVFPPQVWVLKRELLKIPFFGWGLAMTSPIAINRGESREAMRTLLREGKDRLARGFCVVIFPEGTRVPYGQRGKYKLGGALLGVSCGSPVVPVAHNAGKLWGKNAFLKYPGLITLSIGQPIHPQKGMKADELSRQVEAWIEAEIPKLSE
ncbi:1-acyl-sn-glycerol-3-phosphate acyltransferase [Ferriphaselus amnicola]|uniref:1-acyl-sn-glycerol-3-phosphate acyltransferase n=1 Tax=Ferriphaselus amnicola TaxID=1188319 RepID=A0A2Z6GE60_9PROT|nr:lysophospholipid acyltransferase family protein [Ferriphaselus amnicola]BBE51901.1 1-acyl-sn-glycerol-3-phosphate acyltransferase [Ferriphaselus amnicola]